MVLVFVLGVILVMFAILLVSMALDRGGSTSGVTRSLAVLEAMTTAPAEIKAEIDRPFEQRVLAPLQQRLLGIGRRLSGADSADRLRSKLDHAGNPRDWSADRVISVKVLAALALLVIGFALSLVLGAGVSIVILMTFGGLVLGFFGPDLYLYQASFNRAEQLARELPDAIDLLTISVEAGLGFDAACQQVARNTEGPLGEEFARMLAEMQIGQTRSLALRSMAERTPVPEVKAFVGAMVQADAFGIPIGKVLRVQSSEIRVKRRQRAETKAQQVPVKITIPLIFCVLPTLFVAVMGPAAIQIMDNLSKT
jgi:tight adherence protein C